MNAFYRLKTIRLHIQLASLIIIVSLNASAQSASELRNIFRQAESYYLYEEYDLANQLYLLLENPDNKNIKYKIGTCYLNIPGEKEKAISYLEDAVRNASYDAKINSYNELRAPLDAYFYLAKAYMINNELDKALNTFDTFTKLTSEIKSKGGMENLEYLEQQKQACKNAILFQENFIELSKKNIGSEFSQGAINENPAVSFDGNSIVYTERRGMINVILYSRKERDRWQTPVDITSRINAGEDCSASSLNKDGTLLLLYKNDNFDGNIYSSELVNGEWTPIKKLNRNINTKFYESHASVSADGKKLYFTSNRDGGYGGLDLYVSELDASGDWGPATNMGATLNTIYNEDNPFITANDSIIYFSSEGHTSMGGFDNFFSIRQGTSWKTPQNIGFPVNTTDDDKFFQPLNNGRNGFYSMTTGYKQKEIFYLGFGKIDVNQIFEIRGKITLQDTAFNEKYAIHLINKLSGDTIDIGYPNKYTGNYNFSVNPGSFRIIYTGAGYIPQTVDTVIHHDNPVSSVILDMTLEKDPFAVLAPVYEKIDLENIPVVSSIDDSILDRNLNVNDVNDTGINDSDILYYTVQVMALYNPVDISYFKMITNMRVIYNDVDKFYRYVTGNFSTREQASELRSDLIRRGYPNEIFIKKVSR
jgi:tetratricopeptide (TPR) repeat protein